MNVQGSTLSLCTADNDKTYNNIKMKDRTMKMVVAALIAAKKYHFATFARLCGMFEIESL